MVRQNFSSTTPPPLPSLLLCFSVLSNVAEIDTASHEFLCRTPGKPLQNYLSVCDIQGIFWIEKVKLLYATPRWVLAIAQVLPNFCVVHDVTLRKGCSVTDRI